MISLEKVNNLSEKYFKKYAFKYSLNRSEYLLIKYFLNHYILIKDTYEFIEFKKEFNSLMEWYDYIMDKIEECKYKPTVMDTLLLNDFMDKLYSYLKINGGGYE